MAHGIARIALVALLALFASTLAGCNGEILLQPGDSVAVDSAFDAGEAEHLLAGVAAWNEAFPALGLRPMVGSGGDWRVRSAGLGGKRRGSCESHEPLIRIDAGLINAEGNPQAFQSVVMHEIGHALGLNRDGGHAEDGLMRAGVSLTCVDAGTLADVCDKRPELCDGRERATC